MHSGHGPQSLDRRFTLKFSHVLAFTTSPLLFLAIVVPNSMQAATFAMMMLCASIAITHVRWNRSVAGLLSTYLAGAVVTVFFLLIGVNRGAPSAAISQVLIIYLISPLLWIIVSIGMVQQLGEERIGIYFRRYGFLAAVSVAVFYFLYITFGATAVSFFKEDANLNLQDGYAGATMFVYGSLIFLVAGFFACPALVPRKGYRAILLCGLAAAAVTSGRSALILSIPIGLLLGIILLPRVRATNGGGAGTARVLKQMLGLFLIGILAALALSSWTTVQIGVVLNRFFEELMAGGGGVRAEQAAALIGGMADSSGLGSGHGVGVDYLRNARYPWRYELVWLATIHRVGVLGSLVYASPFLIAILKLAKLARARVLTNLDVFLFSGLVSSLIASNTNPYIEAFSFQWMYVIPVVWFWLRRTNEISGAGAETKPYGISSPYSKSRASGVVR